MEQEITNAVQQMAAQQRNQAYGYQQPQFGNQNANPFGGQQGNNTGWAPPGQQAFVGQQPAYQPQPMQNFSGGAFNNQPQNQQPAPQAPQVSSLPASYARYIQQPQAAKPGPVAPPPAAPNAAVAMPVYPLPENDRVVTEPVAQKAVGQFAGQYVVDWSERVSKQWVTTKEQPYPLAFNNRKEILVRKLSEPNNPNASVDYQIHTPSGFNISSEQMDRNRHLVTPITTRLSEFTPPKEAVDIVETYEKLPGSDKPVTMRKEVVPEAIDVNDINEEAYEPDETVESLEEAVLLSKCYYTPQPEGGKRIGSSNIKVTMQKTFVAKDNENGKLCRAILESFAETKTIRQLCTLIERTSHENTGNFDVQQLLAGLDNYLRRALEHAVQYKLGISGLYLDSFTNDAPSLFGYLRDKHGEYYAMALRKHETSFIRDNLILNEKHNYVDLGVDDVKSTRLILHEIQTKAIVTYIDVPSGLLNITLKRGVPNQVLESSLPELYKFIKRMFENNVLDIDVSKFYLVTNDDRVFEYYRGYLGDDNFGAYLIHEVN